MVQATPVSRVSPGGTHTLPGATRLSNLLTATSEIVHAEIIKTSEQLDWLPRPRTCESGTALSKSTAQDAMDRMMICCSCHPAKCNDAAWSRAHRRLSCPVASQHAALSQSSSQITGFWSLRPANESDEVELPQGPRDKLLYKAPFSTLLSRDRCKSREYEATLVAAKPAHISQSCAISYATSNGRRHCRIPECSSFMAFGDCRMCPRNGFRVPHR